MPDKEQIVNQSKPANEGQFFTTTLSPINLKASNLSKEWKLWFTQFKIFLTASNLESQPDRRKVALLLHHLGSDCLEIYNSFDVDLETITYTSLVQKLESFFIPKVNIAMERYKFFTCRQQLEQSVDEYVTVLKNLSLNCEFGVLREDLVRDIFTCGLSAKMSNVREKLLAEGAITLDKAVGIAKSMAMAKQNAQMFENNHEEEPVINVVRRKNYKTSIRNHQQQTKSNNNCNRCGQTHKTRCPAEGAKCHHCSRIGHFAKMCFLRNKVVKHLHAEENGDYDDDDDEENLFVGALSRKTTSSAEWNVEVMVNSSKLICQIDTGAQANIISLKTAGLLNVNDLLRKTKVNIFTFSGEKLRVLGKIFLRVVFEEKMYLMKFFVVDINCNNIIGLQSARDMGLVRNVNVLSIDNIIKKFSNVFGGLGFLQHKCSFKVRKDVTPVIDPPRKIPFKLYDKLENELKRMENLNVIKKVTEPTEWVSSIVLVTKPNGSIRLCLDPRNLNKAILRPHFPFPNVEDCKARLNGSKYFTSLDANSGFWMVPLEEGSSKLCTFNTPFGRYRFLRLPFGINAAPEIFHAQMVKLFGDISGLIIYIDDFLIYSSTLNEHLEILEKVFQRAKDVGLQFNKSKCKILQNEIKFLGHVFNETGVRPDDEKIKSINNIPKPANVKELQRFLGMVNYLGSFIENLSSKNKKLRELLRNDIQWHWSSEHDNEFENLKHEITKSPVLTYFDPNKEITLSVDASNFALGATIMHGRNPIAYASVSLTESQKNYAQIEKELFAILFGCTKFHQYVYGSKILVETDHKPLVSLFEKPLYKIPARLQRFMLRLQCYNLSVSYKPGKYLLIADTLSRAPLTETALTEMDEEISLHCNFVASHMEIPYTNLNVLKEHSVNDSVYQKIVQYVNNGWPDNKKDVEPEVMPYFKIKNEISILNHVLLKNHQILVPKSLRKFMLDKIHEGHMGVQRCKNLASQFIYWPNIYSEIENLVSNCEICMKYQNSNVKSKMLPHEIVDVPWFKLGCDLFEFNKKMYILVVDYYSKFVEVELLSSGYNSSQVVLKLKSIFSRHGIPCILVSDNGPPFNSKEFREFCKSWEIEHKTSSPYLPRSNGLAERSIQTIKKLFLKAFESNSDPYVALLHYRTTPKGDLPSPAQLLMSRSLRTKIPSLSNNHRPKVISRREYKRKLNTNIEKYSGYYNRDARELKPVRKGDGVMFKRTPTSCWFPGRIVETCNEPRSFVVEDNNGILYRRNQDHIRKTPENKAIKEKTICKPQDMPQSSGETAEDNENNKYVSRKGRVIKQPERLNL